MQMVQSGNRLVSVIANIYTILFYVSYLTASEQDFFHNIWVDELLFLTLLPMLSHAGPVIGFWNGGSDFVEAITLF